MAVDNKYITDLMNAILLFDKKISQVKGLDYIKLMDYTEEDLDKVITLIKNKKIDELERMEVNKIKSKEEDLMVMKFLDQDDRVYIAIMYDSWKLWDDPKVLELFSI